jgi:hypothetical protein
MFAVIARRDTRFAFGFALCASVGGALFVFYTVDEK